MLILPESRYKTIVVDPPWKMSKIKRDVRPNQNGFDYKTMSTEDIGNIILPLADDAFVFLWTTQKYLPDSFRILDLWNLRYRFTMTWHKNGGMQIWNYPQFNSEFVVVGTKGKPKFLDTKAFSTAFTGLRKGHSVKPSEFYKVIRRVCPFPRLDVFARRTILGFDSWGDEAPKN